MIQASEQPQTPIQTPQATTHTQNYPEGTKITKTSILQSF